MYFIFIVKHFKVIKLRLISPHQIKQIIKISYPFNYGLGLNEKLVKKMNQIHTILKLIFFNKLQVLNNVVKNFYKLLFDFHYKI